MARFIMLGPRGVNAVARIQTIKKSLQLTREDKVEAGTLLRGRIIKRTREGEDVNGHAFTRYSNKGPYYYYPPGRTRRARGNFRGSVVRRVRNITGGDVIRTKGGGLKFDSYADFKRSIRSGTVDLTGPHRGGMLDSIRVDGRDGELTLTGDNAAKARGHNEGTRRLPKRRFFAASRNDLIEMQKVMARRIMKRIEAGQ